MKAIAQFKQNLEIFDKLFSNVPEDLRLWKKDENHWCCLEVLCHLVDEEKEDFRARIISLWENPAIELSPIAPKEWVTSRNYNTQDYEVKLKEFLVERKRSLEILESLDSKDERWNNKKIHSYFGEISPLFFLKNWLAHDLLHIRQLTRIRYDLLVEQSNVSLEYAGVWV